MALNTHETQRGTLPDALAAVSAEALISQIEAQLKTGDLAACLTTCLVGVKRYPHSAALWRLSGDTADRMQQQDVAIEAVRQAVRLSGSVEDWSGLADLYLRGGAPRAAARCYEAALEKHSAETALFLPLARAWALAGEDERAVLYLTRYTQDHRQSAEAWRLTGDLNVRLNALEDALIAYKTALELTPDEPALLSNLGLVYQRLGQLDAAVAATSRAAHLHGDCAKTFVNLGNQHFALENLGPAITAYEQAVALDPALHAARAQKLHLQARQCDWRAFTEFACHASQLGLTGQPIAPFAALAFEDDPARQHQRATRHAEKWVTQARDFPVMQAARPRIAYVSSDIYDHATLHLLLGVLDAHDKDQFEVFVYACNPPQEGPLITRLRQSGVQLRYTHALSDSQIVQLARQDAIDIAVDLKGYTRGARSGLFHAGLAPIQVNYLGYPGTLGGGAMDYIIADPVLIPDAQRRHYAEAVVYLPDSYQPNDRARARPIPQDQRCDHDLPETAPVLCCFNESYKIGPVEFAIWMRVMRAVPEAVLWLIDNGADAADALRSEASAAAVQADRLIFAPRLSHDAHMARLPHADLFVDTFICNAHTTASDALWMGVPLVTKTGQQFAARVATSLLRAIDMPELITSDEATYEARTLTLLSDPDALPDLRKQLSDKRLTTALFDTARYTRKLEAAYLRMIASAQFGHPAADIHVT